MTIHHATQKKAEKLGVILSESDFAFNNIGEAAVQAHWPKHNVYAYGYGDKPAQAALAEMEAIIEIKDYASEFVIINKPEDPAMVLVFSDTSREFVLFRDGSTPRDALEGIKSGDVEWERTTCPKDGGEAYRAGFLAGDNPFEEGTEEADQWDNDWDAAADEAEQGDEDGTTGSVVKSVYRTRYAEQGHPNHCGDWLAVTLNNLVQGKTQTDLDRFEAICNANDVDLSKYNRSTNGWQGRLRMTGRNLLVKKVYLAGGVLKLPEGMFPEIGTEMKAPADWMAGQRIKAPKAKEEAKAE